jgi:hypothetical protein
MRFVRAALRWGTGRCPAEDTLRISGSTEMVATVGTGVGLHYPNAAMAVVSEAQVALGLGIDHLDYA